MARIEIWNEQDLQKPVTVKQLIGSTFSEDNAGTLIGAKVTNNGVPIALTGSVTGYIVLPDGTTVSVSGTREDDKAYILLPQSALLLKGSIFITVKLIDSSTITTLAAYVATVTLTKTGTVITPSQEIITDWANAIAAQLQECDDAITNLGVIVAHAFAKTTANAAKTYVTKDGNLYYLPNGHTANTEWADTTKTQVTVGDQLTSAQGQIDTINGKIGNTALPTTAQTMTGAIAEHESDLTNQQGQLTNQQGQITDLKSTLGDITGSTEISSWTNNAYIALNGTTADVSTPTSAPGTAIRCVVVSCSEGDQFTITAEGGSSPRAYGFVAGGNYSTPYKVLEVSGSNETISNEIVTAPENAAYLVINDKSMASHCFVGKTADKRIIDNTNEIDETKDIINEQRTHNDLQLFDYETAEIIDGVLDTDRLVRNGSGKVIVFPVTFTKNETIYVHKGVSSSRFSVAAFYQYPARGVTTDRLIASASAEQISINVTTAVKYIAVWAYRNASDGSVDFNSLLKSISVTKRPFTSFIPYYTWETEEICTIRTKQLLDKETCEVVQAYLDNSTYLTSTGVKSVIIPVEKNGNETLTVHRTIISSRFAIGTFSAKPTNNATALNVAKGNSESQLTVHLDDSTQYLVIFIYRDASDSSLNVYDIIDGLMVQYGNEFTGYESYTKTADMQDVYNEFDRIGKIEKIIDQMSVKTRNIERPITAISDLPKAVGGCVFYRKTEVVANMAFLFDNSIVYVTTDGSVYRITQDGTRTTLMQITGANQWRGFFVSSTGDLFVSPYHCDRSNNGIYKLNAEKTGFTKVYSFTAEGNESTVWTFTEDMGGNLYAGVYDQAIDSPYVLKSTDGGSSWSTVKTFTGRHIHCIYYDKYTDNLYVCIGEGDYNYKSNDGGVTWTKICAGMGKMTAVVSTPVCRIFGTDVGQSDSHNDTEILSAKIYITYDDIHYQIAQEFWSMDIFGLRVSDVTGNIYAYTLVDSALSSTDYFPPVEALTSQEALNTWIQSSPTYLADWQKYYNKWKDIYPEDCIRPQHYAILMSSNGGITWDVIFKSYESAGSRGIYSASQLVYGEIAFCGKCNDSSSYSAPILMKENFSGFNQGVPVFSNALANIIP